MPQCIALTKKGNQCSKSAMEGQDVCSMHFDYMDNTVNPGVDEQPTAAQTDPFAGWTFWRPNDYHGKHAVACGQPGISGRYIFGNTAEEAWANWLAAYERGDLFEESEPAESLVLHRAPSRELHAAPMPNASVVLGDRRLEAGDPADEQRQARELV